MPLEQEVRGMLIGGFTIVMGIAILTTLFLWLKNKNSNFGYFWTILHFLFFSIAIYFFIKAISNNYIHPMASEENSLQIGIAGVVWAFSMICLLMGIASFSKRRKDG
ncbi:MAG: hypothetical protein K0Q87_4998 [Neobacillus sp.]|jgi:ABC-type polysaccharide/polyol phosphate export permease|nr:hypothetical protein [Neobacillus sp.]